MPPAPAAASSGSAEGSSLSVEDVGDLLDRTSRLDEMDYFEILKLDRQAAPVEIKKAFYSESRRYHPDRFYQMTDQLLKEKVHELYKRVTEAYYMLRDDTKRRKYLADITGPERAQKLRFTEASEAETKAASKREQEEQIGTHPKGRQFYQTAVADFDAERYVQAERNLKMALTYEPQNQRYKDKMNEIRQKLTPEGQGQNSFKIK